MPENLTHPIRHFLQHTQRAFAPVVVMLSSLSLFLAPAVKAASGGNIVGGEGLIEAGLSETVINQFSDKLIINWDDFNIPEGQRVQFLQGASTSIALNRVIGAEATGIYGDLLANGRLFLINPNGVLFGESARVDVAGLLATTFDIADEDFLAGRYDFSQSSAHPYSYVVNRGEISVGEHGFVYLVAPGVENSGLILARMGQTVLASGEHFSFDFAGDGLIEFEVSGQVVDQVLGPDGQPMSAAVSNTGEIQNPGGQVVLTADVAEQIMSSVVNTSGIIQATSLTSAPSSVRLEGRGPGEVVNEGEITVSSSEAGTAGGSVAMSGEYVGQFGQLRADSQSGSGGDIDLRSTKVLAMTAGSLTSADAELTGDGGRIIAFSDETILVDSEARLSARGGAESGAGGFVETSGLESFQIGTNPDVSAPAGDAGEWLIDPNDIEIVAGAGNTNINAASPFATTADTAQLGADLITTALGTGDVTITTGVAGLNAQTGNITVNSAIAYTGGAARTLTFNAHDNIVVNQAISSTTAALNLALNANNNAGGGAASGTGAVTLNAAIATNGGTFTSTGVNFTNAVAGTITTGGGAVNLNNSGAFSLGGAVNAGAGNITASGAGNINVNAALTTTGTVSLTSSTGAITDGGAAGSITAGTLTLATSGTGTAIGTSGTPLDITATGTVTATTQNGGIFLNQTGALTLGTITAKDSGTVPVESSGSISSPTNDITITSSGAITLTQAISASNAVTLTAGGALANNSGSSPLLTATTLNLTGTSVGASDAHLKTSVGTLTGTSSAGGFYVTEANTLSTGNVTATGGEVVVEANLGDLTIGGTTGLKSDTKVTVTNSAGSIVDGNAATVNLDAPTVVLTAKEGIGETDSLEMITGTDLTVKTTEGNAGIGVASTAALTNLGVGTHNSDANITFSAGAQSFGFNATSSQISLSSAINTLTFENTNGAIVMNGLTNTGGTVSLSASTNITQTGSNRLIANTATMVAGTNLGASGTELLTTVGTLTATASNGGIFYNNNAALTLSAAASGTGNGVTVTNTGSLALNQVVAPGAISLTATGGAITDNNGTTNNLSSTTGVTLAATGGAIGTSGDPIEGIVSGTASATSSTGGIYLSNIGALTQFDATATDGDLSLTNSGDVAIGAISNTNTKDITLTITGNLTDFSDDDAGTPVVDITSTNNLTISATKVGVDNTKDLEIGVTGNVNVTTTSGGVFLNQTAGALNLVTVTAAGSGSDVDVSAAGQLNLGNVTALGDKVTLTSTGGKIVDARASTTNPNVQSRELVMDAAAGIEGATAGASLALDVSTLSASGGTGDVAAAASGDIMVFKDTLNGKGSVNISARGITILDSAVASTADGTSLITTGAGSVTTIGTGSLKLTATGGNIVFLNTNDTLAMTGAGTITLTATEATDTNNLLKGGAMVLGNLTTAGGNVTITATRDITVGQINTTFGGGDISITSTKGVLVDGNGATTNLIGNNITLVANRQGSAAETLRQTEAFADLAAAQTVQTSEENNLSQATTQKNFASTNATLAANDKTSKTTTYNTELSEYNTENAKLTSLKNQVFVLRTAVSIAQVAFDIADAVSGGAQAIPLSGDAGADAIASAAGIALSVAEIALDVFEFTELDPQDSVVQTKEIELALAKSNLEAATQLDAQATNNLSAAESILNQAQQNYNEAVVTSAVKASIRNQTDSVVAQQGAFGTSTQALGVQANTLNVTAGGTEASNVYIKSENLGAGQALGLGTISPSGTNSIVSIEAANDINITGQVGSSSAATVKLVTTGGAINGTGATTVDTVVATNGVFQAVTGIGATNNIDTKIENLAASTTSGNINVVNSNTTTAMTVNTLESITGVSTEGDITISTTGDLNLTSAITDTNLGTNNTITLSSSGGSILDSAANTATNMTAANAALTAATGIGSGTQAVDVTVTNLDASAGAGGLYVIDTAGGLNVGGASGSITGLSTSGAGNLYVEATGGALTVAETINATGTGNILIANTGATSDINLNTTVTATGGNISISAGRSILQAAAGDVSTTTADKTIDLLAATAITMTDGATLTSNNGVIRLQTTTGDITLGELSTGTAGSTTGKVSLIATAGSILDLGVDTSAVDITAQDLLITANGAIASSANVLETSVANLSAKTNTGDIFVTETDSLTVGALSVAANRVATSGTATALTADSQEDLSSAGDLVVVTTNGALTINGGTASATTGVSAANDILLSAGETAEGTAADLAVNASITSTAGDLSLNSKDAITFGANGDLTTAAASKAVDVKADAAITMVDGTLLTTNNGTIRVAAATGDVTLGELKTGTAGTTTGGVAVIATTGNILDLGTDTSTVDITAQDVLLTAGTGIAASSNALETQVVNLSAKANGGSAFLTESDALIVKDISVTSRQVSSTGVGAAIAADTQEDLTATADLVLATTNGALTINGGTASATTGVSAGADLLLASGETAEGTAADLTLNASVTSTGGDISLSSSDALIQAANGDISATTAAKTLDLLAASGITMADGALNSANNGVIRLESTTGDITLGELNAGTTGKAAIVATAGNILDLGTDTSAVDITAQDAVMTAATAIGAGSNALEVQLANLSAKTTTGGLFLTESDAVTVDNLSVIANRVATDGSVSALAAVAQEDLVSGGDLSLTTTNGTLTVNGGATTATAGVSAANDLLLSAGETAEGTTANLVLNAGVSSTAGDLTLLSADAATFAANGDITATAASKTIDVEAADAVTMVDGTLFTTNNGAIRLKNSAGDITLGELSTGTAGTTTGKVAILAGAGNILDLGVDTSTADITAQDVLLSAGSGIAGSSNALETHAATLTAKTAGGSAFLTEADALTVNNVSVVVNRVSADGSVAAQAADAQEDLTATADLVLTTTNGALTINGGTATATTGVSAGADLLLKSAETAEGTAADLTLNASVTSTGGDVSLSAADSLVQAANGDIAVTGAGKTMDLLAESGVTMADGAINTANNGAIRLETATGDITLGELNAGATGKVALVATAGSILDLGTDTSAVDITAGDGVLTAATAIGAGANALEVQLTNVSGKTTTGGLFLTESDSITVDNLSVVANRVAADGTTSALAAVAQEDLVSGTDLSLSTTNGTLTINGGATTAAAGVTAGNDILLSAGETAEGTTANLVFNASVTSTAGDMSLISADATSFAANGDITASAASKTVDIEAANAITMVDGALITTNNGAIRLKNTTGDITLGELTTGAAGLTTGKIAIVAGAGSILDLGADTSTADLTAQDVLLNAGTAIASSTNPLETRAATLTSRSAAGSTFLAESDSVVVNNVSVVVNRVAADGSVSAQAAETQEDLSSSADLVLATTNGSLTVNGGTASTTTGVSAGQDLLLKTGETAEGTMADLTLNASATSTGGALSINSADAITLSGNGDITTTVDGQTIDLLAASGIAMTQDATLTTTNGTIRVESTQGDISLSRLTTGTAGTTTGKVAIIAGAGSILDNGPNTLDNITTSSLLITAQNGVGVPSNALEINVDKFTGKATTGGLFVDENDNMTVERVTVGGNRVGLDGTVTAVADLSQEDVETGQELVLDSTNGTITVNSGTESPGEGLKAGTTLVFGKSASKGNLLLNTAINSGDGDLNFETQGKVEFTADGDITTTGKGVGITINAVGGITMVEGTVLTTNDGAIDLKSEGGDILLGQISTGTAGSTTGTVTVSTTSGKITGLSTSSSSPDITAGSLVISSTEGIGESGKPLQVALTSLTATTTSGDIILNDADGLTLSNVQTSSGSIQVNAESGDITLASVSAGGTINLTAGSGSIVGDGNSSSVISGNSLNLTARSGIGANGALNTKVNSIVAVVNDSGGINISNEGDLTVEDAISPNGNVSFTTTSGNLSIVANTIESSSSNTVSLVASNGSIVGTTSSNPQIIAGKVSLFASEGIGSSSAPVTVNVDNLVADGNSNGVYLNDRTTGGFTIGGVDGTSVTGLQASGGDIVINSSESISLLEAIENTGSGTTTITANRFSQSADINSPGTVLINVDSLANDGGNTINATTVNVVSDASTGRAFIASLGLPATTITLNDRLLSGVRATGEAFSPDTVMIEPVELSPATTLVQPSVNALLLAPVGVDLGQTPSFQMSGSNRLSFTSATAASPAASTQATSDQKAEASESEDKEKE